MWDSATCEAHRKYGEGEGADEGRVEEKAPLPHTTERHLDQQAQREIDG